MKRSSILTLSAGIAATCVLGAGAVAHAQAQGAAAAGAAQQAPPEGQPPPGYEQAPPPGYQQPPPGYQQPPPGYQQPPPGYQQPPPGYQQPPPGYQAPPGYGQPQPYYPPPPPPPYYGRPYYGPRPYYPPPPPPNYERRGLILGAGIGGGGITMKNCNGLCGGGLALQFDLGLMLTPRFGLMFDSYWVFHPVDNYNTTTTNWINTLAAQIWLTRVFWIKGGIGVGHLTVDDYYYNYDSRTATAFMLGAGVEVLHSPWFSLDLQGRFGYTALSDEVTNGAFLVAFNWY